MFQCNTLYCKTKCSLCSPLAKGYVPPCTCRYLHNIIIVTIADFMTVNYKINIINDFCYTCVRKCQM